MIFLRSADAVQGSFYDLWYTIALYLPRILAAIIVFLIGWIVATVLYRLVVEGVRALKLDSALKNAGVDEAVKEAGFKLDSGRFLGNLVLWFIMLVFLLASLQILGLTVVTLFLSNLLLLFLPQVVVASLILILTAIVAELVRSFVVGSARAAGSRSANFAGSISKWAIWISGVMVALTQLGIATTFIQTLFTGLVVGLSLAFGLAFGLGGKDTAARILDHVGNEIRHDRS